MADIELISNLDKGKFSSSVCVETDVCVCMGVFLHFYVCMYKYVSFSKSISGCWSFPVGSYRLSNDAAQQVVKLDAPSCSQNKLVGLLSIPQFGKLLFTL